MVNRNYEAQIKEISGNLFLPKIKKKEWANKYCSDSMKISFNPVIQ